MFHRTTGLTATVLMLSISLFGLQACGGGAPKTNTKPTQTQTGDVTAPTVQSMSAVGSSVDYTKPIIVTFNENINTNVVPTDVSLKTSGGADVAVSVSASGAELIITPVITGTSTSTQLLAETTYKLILNNTIKDIAGNPFSTIRYTFTTAVQGSGTIDTTAPTVLTPILASTLVDFVKPISITFSENIIAPANSVTLTKAGNTVAINATVSRTSLTITPKVGTLTDSTKYVLTLKNTITDMATPANAFAGVTYTFTTTAANTGGVTKTITFIELNDLHANLVPHTEMVRQTCGPSAPATCKKILVSESRGGLARIATKINEIKAANTNSILMNIGDTYHGGAEALFTNGEAIVGIVNNLNIDVGVPGNWDYAYGPVVSNARFGINGYLKPGEVTRPTFTVLGANAKYKDPTITTLPGPNNGTLARNFLSNTFGTVAGDDFLKPITVIVKNNVRIGFIGLTSDIIELMHPMMAFNIEVTQGLLPTANLVKIYAEALRNPNDKINGNVDFIVVMSELGIHKDLALAEELNNDPLLDNDINIIFSAHTHELMMNYKTSSTGVLVVEPGNDSYLGQMDVTFNTANKAISYNWTIHPITSSLDNSSFYAQNIATMVTDVRKNFTTRDQAGNFTSISIPQIQPSSGGGGIGGGSNFFLPQTLSSPITEIIGQTTIPLDRKNALESTFNNAYTDLLKNSENVDIAITPGFRFDSAVMPANADYWEVENNGVLSGDVTVADVYRFVPAAYFLATADITIAKLKIALERGLESVFSSNTFHHGGGWMFGYAGLIIDVDLTKPTTAKGLDRIRKITDDYSGNNQVLYDASLTTNPYPAGQGFILTAAGCGRPLDVAGLLCSLPGFGTVTPIIEPNGTNNYAASDFLIDQIAAGKLNNNVATRKSIIDASNTPMWPDSEFVQPLRGVK